jgi:phosphatidylinositol-3-phosphatase
LARFATVCQRAFIELASGRHPISARWRRRHGREETCDGEALEPRRFGRAGAGRDTGCRRLDARSRRRGDRGEPQLLGGAPTAPYINGLAASGASFTSYHAIEHPSQPNYLDLFSGSNQGSTNDVPLVGTPLNTPNLGAALIASGRSFATYSESLPFTGYPGAAFTTVPTQNQYVQKHNPAFNWQSPAPTGNQLPLSVNQPFGNFPSSFASLPTVSFVVPNEQNDMHDGTIAQGDAWLQANLAAYQQWALSHNSLLAVVWDEDDGTQGNQVPLILTGSNVISGQYGGSFDHFDLLRTLEAFYGLDPLTANDGAATAITAAFVAPEPATLGLLVVAAPLAVRLRRRRG